MNTELIETTVNDGKISAVVNYSPEEVAVIKRTVAKDVTDTELAYFLMICGSANLNPFLKEIWCYKDNKNNLLIFPGRDGFLKKAQQHPKFGGLRSGVIKENDEWEINIPAGEVFHKITKADRGKIIGAYAFVFRKDEEPTVVFVEFQRYNKGWNTWKSNPEDMIIKTAESKALKKAFGLAEFQVLEEYKVLKNGTVQALEQSLLPDMSNQK